MISSTQGIIILSLEEADAIVRGIILFVEWHRDNITKLQKIGSLQAISDLKSAVRSFEEEY